MGDGKIMKGIENYKENVFNDLFGKRVVEYPVSKNGQNVGVYLEIKNQRLYYHLEELKMKYGFKKSDSDMQSEYISQSWEAIMKFKPESEDEMEGWEAISSGADEKLFNQLISYIKTTVGYKMYEFVNPNAFRTTTTVDGERVHYTLVMEFESLDELLSREMESEASLPVELTDENNVFNNTMYSYYISYFQKWFEENKEDILVDTQLEFLENLKKCSSDPYLTAEEFEEVTGVRWSDYSRRLRRIEARIARAWEKSQPKKKSRKQVADEKILKYLMDYMKIVKRGNPETQNLELTNHLVKGMKDKNLEFTVFKITNNVLHDEKLIEFNRIVNNNNFNSVPLSAKSLYVITDEVVRRVSKLRAERRFEEPEKVESNKKVKNVKKSRRFSELITKDKNGKVIKHEYKLVNRPQDENKHIFFILPTGAQVRKG